MTPEQEARLRAVSQLLGQLVETWPAVFKTYGVPESGDLTDVDHAFGADLSAILSELAALREQNERLREVANTGRDYAQDMADGHLVAVKVTEFRKMGARDLERFDAALSRKAAQ